MLDWHGLCSGYFRPKPPLDDLPCLGQAPKVVPIALGAAFLATNAKVSASNAVSCVMVVPLESYSEPSESAHAPLMRQPFTPVIMPVLLRDAWPCSQRGVQ